MGRLFKSILRGLNIYFDGAFGNLEIYRSISGGLWYQLCQQYPNGKTSTFWLRCPRCQDDNVIIKNTAIYNHHNGEFANKNLVLVTWGPEETADIYNVLSGLRLSFDHVTFGKAAVFQVDLRVDPENEPDAVTEVYGTDDLTLRKIKNEFPGFQLETRKGKPIAVLFQSLGMKMSWRQEMLLEEAA